MYYILPVARRDGGGLVKCNGNEVHRDEQMRKDENSGAMEN